MGLLDSLSLLCLALGEFKRRVITLATNDLIMMMRRRSLWSLVSLLCIMVCATPAAICQTGPQAESVSDPGEKLAPNPSTSLDSTDLLLPPAAAAAAF